MTKRSAARKTKDLDLESWVQGHRKGCAICRHDEARELVRRVIDTQNQLHVKVRYASVADLLNDQFGTRFTDNSVRDHIRRCINGR